MNDLIIALNATPFISQISFIFLVLRFAVVGYSKARI